tara:strand:- start:455 stop:1006 length:552 start_codon:yes stop_codon:yes gene_type:complete
MKRLLVLGSPGAGKTTLSFKLHQHFGYRVRHLDAYYFHPGWQVRDKDEWHKILLEFLGEDFWILDGQSNFLELRVAHADTIIYIDTSRWRCFFRVFRRAYLYRKKNRPDRPEGCPEIVSRDLLKYIWSWPEKRKKMFSLFYNVACQKTVYILKDDQEISDFITNLKNPVLLEKYLFQNRPHIF